MFEKTMILLLAVGVLFSTCACDIKGNRIEIKTECEKNENVDPEAPEIGCDGKDNNCNGKIDEKEIVVFDDDYFESVIRESTGISEGTPVMNHDMCKIKELTITDKSPQNINGIEYAFNLAKLELKSYMIHDISPLSGLVNLKKLRLFGCYKGEVMDTHDNIHDLSGLSNLPNLISLDLMYYITGIDIRFLAGLPKLKELNFFASQIDDITPLADLKTLEKLILLDNMLYDYSPLAGLTNLKELYIGSIWTYDSFPGAFQNMWEAIDQNGLLAASDVELCNECVFFPNSGTSSTLSDFSILSKLTRLETLYLIYSDTHGIESLSKLTNLKKLFICSSNIDGVPLDFWGSGDQNKAVNLMTDLTPLSNLTELNKLILKKNSFGNISALSGLSRLERLDLVDNNINDITKISSLTNLSSLNLQNNNLSDISALADLTELNSLNLQNNRLHDISELAGLKQLKTLRLAGNELSDIRPLSGLNTIEDLTLANNRLPDIDVLGTLKKLTKLTLNNNEIRDISPLANLTNLTSLMLSNNSLSDISALSGLNKLTYLTLDNNLLSDISALTDLTELTDLTLSNNRLADIKALSGLTRLITLALDDNTISDINALTDFPELTFLSLQNNEIIDISALTGLTSLEGLFLQNNLIDDIGPLVANSNSTGDDVHSTDSMLVNTKRWYIENNPLYMDDCQDILSIKENFKKENSGVLYENYICEQSELWQIYGLDVNTFAEMNGFNPENLTEETEDALLDLAIQIMAETAQTHGIEFSTKNMDELLRLSDRLPAETPKFDIPMLSPNNIDKLTAVLGIDFRVLSEMNGLEPDAEGTAETLVDRTIAILQNTAESNGIKLGRKIDRTMLRQLLTLTDELPKVSAPLDQFAKQYDIDLENIDIDELSQTLGKDFRLLCMLHNYDPENFTVVELEELAIFYGFAGDDQADVNILWEMVPEPQQVIQNLTDVSII